MAETERKESSLTSRAFWLMFAKTLGFAFTFLLPPVLVRHLTQSEYGLFKQVFLVVNTAVTLLPLGFGMSAYYFLPRGTDRERKQVVFNVLLFSAFVGALGCAILVLRPTLLASVFNDPTLVGYAPLIGVVILFWVVSSFLETVAVANQETRVSTAFIIGAQLTKTLFMLGAILFFGSLRALVYASLLQGALQTALLLLYLNSRFPGFWRTFDFAMLRTQMAYAMPLGLAGLLFTAQTDLHNYFVSHRFGPAEFAIYSVGCMELPLIGLLRDSINSVMLPRVSFLEKQGETEEIIRLMARVMRKLAAFFFPIYALFMVVGREFITFLFTANYLGSWPVMAINLTVIPLSILMMDPVLRAYAEHRYFLLKVRVVMSVLLVAGLWYGSNRFGLIGAVGVVVAVNLIERVALVFKFGRVLNVSRRDLALVKDVGKLALASALAAGATALVRLPLVGLKPFVVLAVCGTCFALVYLAATWALRVVTDEEFDLLRGKIVSLQRRTYLRRAADPLS